MARLEDLFPEIGGRDGTTSADPVAAPGTLSVPSADLGEEAPDLSTLGQPRFGVLSGQAGTGKTFLARQLAAEREDVVLCATTGIAAVNMGDAVTINALLGYFDTNSLMSAYASGYLSTRLRRLRKSGVRLLVLDEVSMLDANQLTVLCQALDDVNLKKDYDASLGEVQETSDDDLELRLLLVGDFAQLPPVEAPFAFESPDWARFADHTIHLRQIHRQGDPTFIQALQAVRRGDGRAALPTLQSQFAQTLDFSFPGTTIVGQNQEVDRINLLRHAQLPGDPWVWKTVRSGEQQKDWLRLIPEQVEVKPGALVMILMNRSLGYDADGNSWGYAYVNGDLGTVVDKTDLGIVVQLQRTGETQTVVPVTSEWREPTGKKNPAYTVRGAVTRMPLRLAYATTVHKSQGLSLDHVQVNLTNWMFKKPGMLYVALSRCRTLEGLRVVGTPRMFMDRCTVEPKIVRFL